MNQTHKKLHTEFFFIDSEKLINIPSDRLRLFYYNFCVDT